MKGPLIIQNIRYTIATFSPNPRKKKKKKSRTNEEEAAGVVHVERVSPRAYTQVSRPDPSAIDSRHVSRVNEVLISYGASALSTAIRDQSGPSCAQTRVPTLFTRHVSRISGAKPTLRVRVL